VPTPTYTPLANVTLGTAATGITFASIPSSYRDLIIIVQAKAVTSNISLRAIVNSSTASIYSRQRMSSNGSTASAATLTSTQFQFTSDSEVSTTDGYNGIFHFLDYSATDKHKVALARSNNGDLGTDALSGRWASTNAINSIQVYSSADLAAGSTFALYGIVA
jgi:hypothetical protein